MKFYSLLAGLGLCCGLTGVANAKIVTGTSEGYLYKVYATDLSGNRLPDFDATCKRNHASFYNYHFYTDFRVNTEGHNNVAFMTLNGSEVQLSNSGYCPEKHKYVFKSSEISTALQDSNVKSVEFTLDHDMWHATATVVFNPETAKPYHCDCDHHANYHDDHHDCDGWHSDGWHSDDCSHHDSWSHCDCSHCDCGHDHDADSTQNTEDVTFQCVISTH